MEAAALTETRTRGIPALGQARLLRLAGDDRLVRAVRGGSDAAFEVLYERHHRALLAFCRHMLGTREEAEDAVQSTFLAAYHELRTDDERPIHLQPWLFTIARHRCLRVLRARRPRAEADLEQHPVATEGLGEQVQRRADLRELLADVGRLPEDQRAALLLAELHAMSHRDIAAVLDVPAQKVKALVFQARSSLIATRRARAIPCGEVRAQLGELTGGSLRRRELQRHLRDCPGCSEFRAQLRRQKAMFAAALPVVPTAGLRAGVFGATTGGAGGAGGGGLVAGAAALKGAAVKLAIGAGATAALAGGVVAGSGEISGLSIGHHGHAVVRASGHPAYPASHPPAAAGPAARSTRARAAARAGHPQAARRSAAAASPPARHHGRPHTRHHHASATTPSVATPSPDPAAAPSAHGQRQGVARGHERKAAQGEAPKASSQPEGATPGNGNGNGQGNANGQGNGNGQGNANGQGNGNGAANGPGKGNASIPASEAPQAQESEATSQQQPGQQNVSPGHSKTSENHGNGAGGSANANGG
jgi:RNA polymerase sigma factor (sigma-70 family)